VAVVGAGPGGFYAAGALLKAIPTAEVSLLERLVSPYGLVRYGVAPDHASLKSVTAIFERIGNNPRLRYFGHTAVWRDVSMDELKTTHHAVVLAIGASADRTLNLPSMADHGVYSASQMVGWYNGHPDHAHFSPDLGRGRVCIFGHGNVAVDLARILLCEPETLSKTDISQSAFEILKGAPVKELHLVGRRGPTHTRFSAPVIKELLELPGVEVVFEADYREPPRDCDTDISLAARDAMAVLKAAADRPPGVGARRLTIHYWSTPKLIMAADDGLEVSLAREHGPSDHKRLTVDTVITAIGYELNRSHCSCLALSNGSLSNERGRLLDNTGKPIKGLYAVGWSARGASGTIGTCRSEAERLTQVLAEDSARAPERQLTGSDGLAQILQARGHRYVTFQEWLQLEAMERARGTASGRSRIKFHTSAQMLAFLEQTFERRKSQG
jgi:ferredoxin--NADP+ reductase